MVNFIADLQENYILEDLSASSYQVRKENRRRHLPKTRQKPVLQPPQEDEFHSDARRTPGSSLAYVDVEKQHGEQRGETVGPVDAHHHSHLHAHLKSQGGAGI